MSRYMHINKAHTKKRRGYDQIEKGTQRIKFQGLTSLQIQISREQNLLA